MTDRPTYTIDGARFSDLDGFYDEISRQLLPGVYWGRNLDALNDIMRGDVGDLPEEFRLVWKNAGLSKARLAGTGRASFADLFDIICDHTNVELILA